MSVLVKSFGSMHGTSENIFKSLMAKALDKEGHDLSEQDTFKLKLLE